MCVCMERRFYKFIIYTHNYKTPGLRLCRRQEGPNFHPVPSVGMDLRVKNGENGKNGKKAAPTRGRNRATVNPAARKPIAVLFNRCPLMAKACA